MLNLNHKNLDVWKISIELISYIYQLTEKFPKSEIFGISNQLRRAAVSITSNIAEGAAKKSKIERKRYFETSRASLVEIDTQLEICLKIKYITISDIPIIDEKMNHLFAKMTKLILNT